MVLRGCWLLVVVCSAGAVHAASQPIAANQAVLHELQIGTRLRAAVPVELKDAPDSAAKTVEVAPKSSVLEVLEAPTREELRGGYHSFWYKVRRVTAGAPAREGFVWRGDLPVLFVALDSHRFYSITVVPGATTRGLFVYVGAEGQVKELEFALPPDFIDRERYGAYGLTSRVKGSAIAVQFEMQACDGPSRTYVFDVSKSPMRFTER